MIEQIKFFLQELSMEWEDFRWKYSDERQELASMRLAAHRLSVEKGYESPYTHPDEYTSDWTPIKTLR